MLYTLSICTKSTDSANPIVFLIQNVTAQMTKSNL